MNITKYLFELFKIYKKYLLGYRQQNNWGLIILLFSSVIHLEKSHAQTSRTVYVGDEVMFVVPKPPNNGAIYQSAWASKHQCISLVTSDTYSATFKINSYFEGNATIQCDYYYRALNPYTNTFVSNNATAYYSISCKPVTINFSPKSMSLCVSETQKITYSTSPKSVNVRFSSSDRKVATVSSTGYVTAVSSGNAKITLSSDYGPSAEVDVNVKNIEPTSITIIENLTTFIGESVQLSFILKPSNTNTKLTWFSENEEVATVEDGKVTGISEGETGIYVVTSNGLKSNVCEVKVMARDVIDISLDSIYFIPVGDIRKINPIITPTNAKTLLYWTSNNNDIVSVTSSGEITAHKVGQTNITVRTDNGLIAKCEVISLPIPICLVAWTSDGSCMSYPLEERPIIMHDRINNYYIIKTTSMQIEYPAAFINRFTLSDTTTPEDNEPLSVSNINKWGDLKYNEKVVHFSSMIPNSSIFIYDTNGRKIMSSQTSSNGVAVMDISELPKGIYVVKINNITYKIVKR